MEFRQLGRSGLKVSVLSLGTMTFGGKGNFAKTGSTDIEGARRQIDLCLVMIGGLSLRYCRRRMHRRALRLAADDPRSLAEFDSRIA
jgi:hypothetical protein